MCSPVCNAFSGVHDLLGSVISVFSSVSNKVSSVAHAHLTSAAGWGSSVDFSISRYGYIKTQFTSCLTLASDCIQKVAQMVYRLIISVDTPEKQNVLAAVAQDGLSLVYASAELRGDKEVVMAAVAQNGRALQYASDALRGDKGFMLAAMAHVRYQAGGVLKHASDALKADKGFILAAAAQDGTAALFFASAELKGDKDVVIAAAAQDGWALRNASAGLRVDPDVVIVARGARVHPFTG